MATQAEREAAKQYSVHYSFYEDNIRVNRTYKVYALNLPQAIQFTYDAKCRKGMKFRIEQVEWEENGMPLKSVPSAWFIGGM